MACDIFNVNLLLPLAANVDSSPAIRDTLGWWMKFTLRIFPLIAGAFEFLHSTRKCKKPMHMLSHEKTEYSQFTWKQNKKLVRVHVIKRISAKQILFTAISSSQQYFTASFRGWSTVARKNMEQSAFWLFGIHDLVLVMTKYYYIMLKKKKSSNKLDALFGCLTEKVNENHVSYSQFHS